MLITSRRSRGSGYYFTKDGMMENEICPILVGGVEHEPVINPDEVQAVRWREWNAVLEEIAHDPTFHPCHTGGGR
jgi:isopentenyldiphosphate isomerase